MKKSMVLILCAMFVFAVPGFAGNCDNISFYSSFGEAFPPQGVNNETSAETTILFNDQEEEVQITLYGIGGTPLKEISEGQHEIGEGWWYIELTFGDGSTILAFAKGPEAQTAPGSPFRFNFLATIETGTKRFARATGRFAVNGEYGGTRQVTDPLEPITDWLRLKSINGKICGASASRVFPVQSGDQKTMTR